MVVAGFGFPLGLLGAFIAVKADRRAAFTEKMNLLCNGLKLVIAYATLQLGLRTEERQGRQERERLDEAIEMDDLD